MYIALVASKPVMPFIFVFSIYSLELSLSRDIYPAGLTSRPHSKRFARWAEKADLGSLLSKTSLPRTGSTTRSGTIFCWLRHWEVILPHLHLHHICICPSRIGQTLEWWNKGQLNIMVPDHGWRSTFGGRNFAIWFRDFEWSFLVDICI